MTQKIGILGSGMVGITLANGFVKHGYQVMLGSNTPSKFSELKIKTHNKASIGSFKEAAIFGEIVILAVKGTVAGAVVTSLGDVLNGKTVIDTTNPIAESMPVNGVLQYFTATNSSLMESLQISSPAANFVKAFSCVGNAHMVDPDFHGQKPSMFICGNNTQSKQEVASILTKFGWEIEDMGKVEAARAIEPLAMLWCIPGFLTQQWNHAFKVLRK
jgi:predicted dinucleotide-binding enzyme